MATDIQPGEFVITPRADELLSSFSEDFSSLLLEVASKSAVAPAGGPKVVRTDDIKAAFLKFCATLEEGIKSGDLDDSLATHVRDLREFCGRIAGERAAAPGGQTCAG